jgi:CubicO group peptidase (beta-lactamase class C family)
MGKIQIKGNCSEKFAGVKEVFRRNFEEGLEVGASLAVTIDGKFVVDLWGGFMDGSMTQAWGENTIVNVYSTTKVMTSICIHILVDRGLLDLDDPVAKYWPEFGQAGKEKIPVRYLLSHSSGLAGWDESLQVEDYYNWEYVTSLLEKQKPWWEPGTKCGYHAMTFGFLLGELVRRITNKTLGEFFREEVGDRLGADFYIGLPKEHDNRVAELIPPPPMDLSLLDSNSVAVRTIMNPNNELTVNQTKTREWRQAEIPAANGHGNARSVAKITAAIACGGDLNGTHILSLKSIQKSIEEQIYDIDLVVGTKTRYGLGWGLQNEEEPIGPNPNVFYWGGYGGSVVIIDLDARMSIAYVMNKMENESPRFERLQSSIYKTLYPN